MKKPHAQKRHGHRDSIHRHAGCFHDDRFKLLDLKEIMDLEANSDLVFSLKVLAASFELVAMEFEDPDFRSGVLGVCEQNIRHGHTLEIVDRKGLLDRPDAEA
jgi:hypothetical protein